MLSSQSPERTVFRASAVPPAGSGASQSVHATAALRALITLSP
jgi:hypothetical protein